MKRYMWMWIGLGITLGGNAQADDWQTASNLMDAGSYTAAAEIFKRMAEANDMRAVNILAIMYSRGTGVDRDIDKALEYAIRVDAAGSNARTQGYVSVLYMAKTPSDAAASYAWLKKATSTEVVPGLFFRLAKYYEGGVGVPVNQERAHVWYLMSRMSPEANMDKYNRQKLMVQIKVSELESDLSEEQIEADTKQAETCFSIRSEACY